jgi:hypothetical protein
MAENIFLIYSRYTCIVMLVSRLLFLYSGGKYLWGFEKNYTERQNWLGKRFWPFLIHCNFEFTLVSSCFRHEFWLLRTRKLQIFHSLSLVYVDDLNSSRSACKLQQNYAPSASGSATQFSYFNYFLYSPFFILLFSFHLFGPLLLYLRGFSLRFYEAM